VTAGLAIYDTVRAGQEEARRWAADAFRFGRVQMQFIHCPVHTIVCGQASSMASLILAGGSTASALALFA
jgi:ATP-dependent protease ClpP protease subunit